MSLTKTLGRFVADLSPNRLPEDAVRIARLGFIDCIGTMIAGRREDCVRIMKQVLAPIDGPATLTFGSEKSTAPVAVHPYSIQTREGPDLAQRFEHCTNLQESAPHFARTRHSAG